MITNQNIAKALFALCLLAAGCAEQPVFRSPNAPITAQQWTLWGQNDKTALAAYSAAKTPSEIKNAIGQLIQVADSAPTAEARLMITHDICLAAAAAGDGVTLQRFTCEKGALNVLFGGN